jgi:hypothetical protein
LSTVGFEAPCFKRENAFCADYHRKEQLTIKRVNVGSVLNIEITIKIRVEMTRNIQAASLRS